MYYCAHSQPLPKKIICTFSNPPPKKNFSNPPPPPPENFSNLPPPQLFLNPSPENILTPLEKISTPKKYDNN